LKTVPLDAETFAEWGVDYVKFDGCHVAPALLNFSYPSFVYLSYATGRPMVYCTSWPAYEPFARIQVPSALVF
jgi:Alpha galactosidase A